MTPNAYLAAWAIAALASCSLRGSEPLKPDPLGYVRITPTEIEEDEDEEALRRKAAQSFDPERRKRSLAKRFPGLRSIDFVRLLVTPEEGAESCRTEIPPPWETEIDIDYEIDGEKGSASGIVDLKAQGWWPTYGAPRGFGVERRASFDALDVRLTTRFACRCAARPGGDEGWRPLELRFRWAKGKMPEVSAAVTAKGKRRGLRPQSVYGHLLTYDFAALGAFPVENPARCGAHATLAILADPPIL